MSRKARPDTSTARPPVERMLKIHHLIKSGKFPNATLMSAQLEVSVRSVMRDLEFMRDRMGLPLQYEPRKHGFFYTQEVEAFPTLQITEGELFALLVAEKALQQYRGTNFERPLVSAFQKMAASLPDTISLNMADWEQTISFRTSAEPVLNLQNFDLLAKATAKHKQIQISYRKPGNSQPEQRKIDPYHLANINGEWFLFAFDHLRNDIRTFVPSRIQKVEFTGKTFQRPAKFSLEQTLQNSFGVHSGKAIQEVVIRFSPDAADYIREKKWHPSQTLRELKNGSVELRLNLSSLGEIERWILGWGGSAVVMAPKELAESVRQAATKILQNTAKRA
ncbi:MAG TPA: WYL domain-containing protein [Candidatus Saccharimonadales bacterium]|nr:WYL domain-containing protein [Candidatus Saccharimonadales bacterium]